MNESGIFSQDGILRTMAPGRPTPLVDCAERGRLWARGFQFSRFPTPNSGITIHAALVFILDQIKQMAKALDYEKQVEGAKDLVIRARAGDQVASASIELIRMNAPTSGRANVSAGLIQKYIEQNPVPDRVTFSSDFGHCSNSCKTSGAMVPRHRLCVEMANGPPLSMAYMGDVIDHFGAKGSHKRKVIAFGVNKFSDPRALSAYAGTLDNIERELLEFGRCMGMARAIQIVRKPGSRLSVLSPVVGWEMGE